MAEPIATGSPKPASRALINSQRSNDFGGAHEHGLAAAIGKKRGHERARSSVHPHSLRTHTHHGHRHHRSQQIGTSDMPATAQISDLFSPVKAAASNALNGAKGTASAGIHAGRRGSSSERAGESAAAGGAEKSRRKENVSRPWRTDWSWKDVQREKARNERMEEHLRSTYTSLVSSMTETTTALHERHASLAASLTATKTLLTQLRDLQSAASRHLDSLTTSSLPDLAASSRTHLAALERAHVAEGRTQLATLEARVATARQRTSELRERVAVCAGKASVHEERERAETRRHKRRVGLFWSVFVAVLALWIAAMVWRDQDSIGTVRTGRNNRATEELRSVLRSKGVEWALDGDGDAVDEHEKGRYKRGKTVDVKLESRADPAQGRIEKMFESL